MKKQLLFGQMSNIAWQRFCQNWMTWVGLATGGIVLMIAGLVFDFYMPTYGYFSSIVLCFVGAFYTAMLHQNGLDAVYDRPLSGLHITPRLMFASLFFIAISLYNPFPEYSEILFFMVPADFKVVILLDWVLHLFISYLLFRCMFVGMILLAKQCNVITAFKESFRLTSHHLLLLFALFIYLALLLYVSSLTIIGYFIALPYTVIMKSVIFKALQENVEL